MVDNDLERPRHDEKPENVFNGNQAYFRSDACAKEFEIGRDPNKNLEYFTARDICIRIKRASG